MAFEDYQTKDSVVIVYTGEGKGKTSAGLGLLVRGLGNRNRVAFIQFIKYWGVSEHIFLRDIQHMFNDQLFFYKGGKGFYNANELSARNVTPEEHQEAAMETYQVALEVSQSGKYDIVICDEINNALHENLLSKDQVQSLITQRAAHTSLCLTGRDFPKDLLSHVDIATNMSKVKHHFDDKFLAQKGIDY